MEKKKNTFRSSPGFRWWRDKHILSINGPNVSLTIPVQYPYTFSEVATSQINYTSYGISKLFSVSQYRYSFSLNFLKKCPNQTSTWHQLFIFHFLLSSMHNFVNAEYHHHMNTNLICLFITINIIFC